VLIAESRFGNNPELTACGKRQAASTAESLLVRSTQFASIMSSPFVRCLQTALPLVLATGLKLKVAPVLSEDRQIAGPFQPRHSNPSLDGAADWAAIEKAWDPTYSAAPIPTPEGNTQYWHRMKVTAPAALRAHVVSLEHPGAVALYTHAGPSFSLAFGLCGNLFDDSVEAFVNSHVVGEGGSLEGMAPAGVIHIVLDSVTGECISIDQPDNKAWHQSGCGMTVPHKTKYEANPGKYWPPPAGVGTGVVDRSGD